MRKYSPEKGTIDEMAEINLIPVIGVSLVLLLMLMLLNPMITQSMIKIFASQAVAGPSANEKSKDKPLYIDITEKGIFLNDNKIAGEEELFLKLRGELSRNRDKTVMVTARERVVHGTVVRVLDISKQAGAVKLALLKRKAS